jgi:hypothetical protein
MNLAVVFCHVACCRSVLFYQMLGLAFGFAYKFVSCVGGHGRECSSGMCYEGDPIVPGENWFCE